MEIKNCDLRRFRFSKGCRRPGNGAPHLASCPNYHFVAKLQASSATIVWEWRLGMSGEVKIDSDTGAASLLRFEVDGKISRKYLRRNYSVRKGVVILCDIQGGAINMHVMQRYEDCNFALRCLIFYDNKQDKITLNSVASFYSPCGGGYRKSLARFLATELVAEVTNEAEVDRRQERELCMFSDECPAGQLEPCTGNIKLALLRPSRKSKFVIRQRTISQTCKFREAREACPRRRMGTISGQSRFINAGGLDLRFPSHRERANGG
ncbi:hypothetical protein WN55_07299 [Dufourea novaeangliae]|uniref:Uncharacterized protein n=1 Tax=Dufourea novaeangliae TaxID=178035 RepID=A0A154P6C0_DUFNO|nr:hypothetical protein WN55_07299 [Dufourea novaeangliae]